MLFEGLLIWVHMLSVSSFACLLSQTLALLEEEDDINLITDYFSYEHFYVIYCKFWELDTDHDLFIEQKDLARYNGHGKTGALMGSGVHKYLDSGAFYFPLDFVHNAHWI